MALTKIFRCNDGGLYYVREIGSSVWWFGEHRDGIFANIFYGQRNGSQISGRWIDVPKGKTPSSGELRLTVGSEDNSLTRVSATGGFGGSSWEKYVEPDVPLPTLRSSWHFRRAGFESSGAADLTGTWIGNDGGTYYLRQRGNEVAWFGERRQFSNVFLATRAGNSISGQWADVPKGSVLQSGNLELNVQNGWTIRRTGVSGGFGGSEWTRVEAVNVDVNLATLVLHEIEDVWGDEPFLWTIFIKVDGDTFDLSRLSSSHSTVISNSGSHNNLTRSENLGKGKRLAIPPHVGRYPTVFKTLRGLDPSNAVTRNNTRLAFLTVAFDEDGTSDGAIEAGRSAAVSELRKRLDESVRSLTAPDEAALRTAIGKAAREAIVASTPWWNVGGWADPDDKLGQEVRQFSFNELRRSIGTDIPLDLRFREHGAHYQVTGWIRVT